MAFQIICSSLNFNYETARGCQLQEATGSHCQAVLQHCMRRDLPPGTEAGVTGGAAMLGGGGLCGGVGEPGWEPSKPLLSPGISSGISYSAGRLDSLSLEARAGWIFGQYRRLLIWLFIRSLASCLLTRMGHFEGGGQGVCSCKRRVSMAEEERMRKKPSLLGEMKWQLVHHNQATDTWLGWRCHHHPSCYWQGIGGRKFTLKNLLQLTLCFGYIGSF